MAGSRDLGRDDLPDNRDHHGSKTVQIRIGDRSQPKVKLKFLNDQIENLTIKKG